MTHLGYDVSVENLNRRVNGHNYLLLYVVFMILRQD